MDVWLAEGSSADTVGLFSQYGVLGIVAGGLIWFARGAHQRERERADRLEAENKRLNDLLVERAIPALTSSARVAEQATQLLAAMQRERERFTNRTGGD